MAKGQTIALKCEACRREGTKLFLKGARCESPKCAFHRRDYPPGQHPFRRGKISEYAVRVREKQRCKRTFGLRERPFRRLFALAERQAGNTGENLFRLLERRLDNVLFRMGLALSRRHARQAIAHGLIFVNGHKLNRPGYLVETNDTIAPRPKEKVVSLFKAIKESTKGRAVPSWLDVQPEPLEGKVTALPKADELAEGFEPQLIVEICAR
jgi:small subunit ribosomal protein S4